MDADKLVDFIKKENEQTRRHFDEKSAEIHLDFDEKFSGIKRFVEEKSAETQRHFDVVAESLRSDICKVAEAVTTNTERLDRVDSRLEKVEVRLDRLEIKVEVLDQKVSTLDQKVNTLDQKLDAFIVETRTNFEEVRASIKFSYAELDRRLTFLESGFKDLSSRMASLEGRLSQ